jgi:hypothetical protein
MPKTKGSTLPDARTRLELMQEYQPMLRDAALPTRKIDELIDRLPEAETSSCASQ